MTFGADLQETWVLAALVLHIVDPGAYEYGECVRIPR